MTQRPGLVERRLGSGWLTVTVGGQLVPADRVGPVTIRHGREDVDAQPTAGTASVLVDRAALAQLPTLGDELRVELSAAALTQLGASPTAAAAARVRFVGDVTDARLAPRTAAGQSLLQLVAVAPLARLARGLRIGDTPWPAELDGPRAARILARCAALAGVVVDYVGPGTATVLARDVDAQPTMQLLADLAAATGGQLHAARDGRLSWHDANHRRNAPTVVKLRPDDVMRDVEWLLDLSGVVNDVTVAYGVEAVQPGNTEASKPTTSVVDPVAVARYGRTAATLDTELQTAAAAVERARQLVGRRSRPAWRIDGVEVELLRTLHATQALALLAAQPGSLLRVTGWPDAGPEQAARLFVEGWTESATRNGYGLSLDVVGWGAAGASPRWVDVDPDTSWTEVPTGLTWLAALGWDTDADLGRWLDLPDSGQSWTQHPTTSWATA